MTLRSTCPSPATKVLSDCSLDKSLFNGTGPADKTSARVDAIQIWRGIAAILVMMFHLLDTMSIFYATKPPKGYETGAIGVDLFFVISGFIMMHSSRNYFGQPGAINIFIKKRLIRIVPLYWIIMLVHACLIVIQQRYNVLKIDVIGTSLIFWPHRNGNGNIYPFFPLGWTLNFEMFFYVVFAMTLRMTARRALVTTCLAFAILVIIGLIYSLPDVLIYWSNPIILEFPIGLTIGYISIAGYKLRKRYAICMLAGGGACVCAAIVSGYHAGPPGMVGEMTRCFIWGIPCGLILAGSTLWPWRFGAVKPLILALGDASYSLYLVHIPIFTSFRLLGVFEFTARLLHSKMLAELAYIVLSTGTVMGVAWICHSTVEKPISKALGLYFNKVDKKHYFGSACARIG